MIEKHVGEGKEVQSSKTICFEIGTKALHYGEAPTSSTMSCARSNCGACMLFSVQFNFSENLYHLVRYWIGQTKLVFRVWLVLTLGFLNLFNGKPRVLISKDPSTENGWNWMKGLEQNRMEMLDNLEKRFCEYSSSGLYVFVRMFTNKKPLQLQKDRSFVR